MGMQSGGGPLMGGGGGGGGIGGISRRRTTSLCQQQASSEFLFQMLQNFMSGTSESVTLSNIRLDNINVELLLSMSHQFACEATYNPTTNTVTLQKAPQQVYSSRTQQQQQQQQQGATAAFSQFPY